MRTRNVPTIENKEFSVIEVELLALLKTAIEAEAKWLTIAEGMQSGDPTKAYKAQCAAFTQLLEDLRSATPLYLVKESGKKVRVGEAIGYIDSTTTMLMFCEVKGGAVGNRSSLADVVSIELIEETK